MTSFISRVLRELLDRKTPISEYTFVLPGKRSGSYLIDQLSRITTETIFSPRVFSIEEFIEEISGLKSIDNISALFEFYSVYKSHTSPEDLENFETFSSWGQTLLHDFNEVDRYLIEPDSFFGYLSNIQELQQWYMEENRTPLMENYLIFWKRLPFYYRKLQESMEEKAQAYQGMVYRKASQEIDQFISKADSKFIFIGFNALNNSEQKILQVMLKAGIAEVFWDIDEVFFNDPAHDASLFMRKYREQWPYYQNNSFNHISSDFSGKKNIEIAGIPKNVGQAKYIGELLAGFTAAQLRDTAIVLGDESLLLPVLNSLPPMEEGINVTMGFPLKNAPVSFIFEHLLKLHSRQEEKLYYKDILAVSNHPLILKITSGSSKAIVDRLKKENLIYIDPDDLIQNIPEKLRPLYRICFGGWKGDPERALVHLQELLFMIKEKLDRVNDKITLEFLYQYHVLFNKLHNLMDSFGHISTIKTLYSIFKDLVQTQTVDFKGEPFNGLQIMGMLESRVLDFENVIVTAVNEGTLPAGKSSNSFIPFDLKCRYSLPTYKEKDAIYTYHFYHLLQRAEHIFLLYNNDMEGFKAGEKSRFLLQLEINTQPAHTLKKYNFTPEVPSVPRKLQTINKSPEIMEKIRERAARGFSPSALTTYIRNPIDFYQQYILGVREGEEVEEIIAYNTLGTVVHDTLEKFYRQWIGSQLNIEQIKAAMEMISSEVALQFERTYAKQPIKSGKNLLIFEVAKRYVSNFLKMEIREIEKGNITEILQVENDLKAEIIIPDLDFPVFINGKVDRVDRFNGTKRIIDYKTGKVEQKHVEISEWEMLTEDYDKYGKTFQILTYAFMLNQNNPFTEPVEAGIISFKNLKNGFLQFKRKGSVSAKGTEPEIDHDVLESYKTQLERLIKEICNQEIAFTEKEIPKKSW